MNKLNVKNILIAFVVFAAVIGCFFGSANSSAKYNSSVSGSGDASVARPVFLVDFMPDDIVFSEEESGELHFSVTNKDENDNISETAMKFVLEITFSQNILAPIALYAATDNTYDKATATQITVNIVFQDGKYLIYEDTPTSLAFGVGGEITDFYILELGEATASADNITMHVVARGEQID